MVKLNEDYKSGNFTKGRKTTVDTVIIHHTGGNSALNTLKWFQNKDSHVSAHYVISRVGIIYKCVDEENTAWHCGISSLPNSKTKEVGNTVNHRSIGIELVNKGDGKTDFPKEQMAALKELLADIKSRRTIKFIYGHKEIAPGRKTDPADNFDWKGLR